MRDPEVPLHRKKAVSSRQKKYGVEQWSRWFKKWCFPTWYRTEKARDQAFENLITKTTILKEHGLDPQVRKVNR
jgi:hypothetical protein